MGKYKKKLKKNRCAKSMAQCNVWMENTHLTEKNTLTPTSNTDCKLVCL
jgi:hypothetical protein